MGEKKGKKKKTLHDHIKEQVEKAGFPLEIEIYNLLEENDWDPSLSPSFYFDKDEEKYREIDIIADKLISRLNEMITLKPYFLSICLIIECKKSDEYAWVFYTQPRNVTGLDSLGPIKQDFINVAIGQKNIRKYYRIGMSKEEDLEKSNLDHEVIYGTPIIKDGVDFKDINIWKIINVGEVFSHLKNDMVAKFYKEIKIEGYKGEGLPEIYEGMNTIIKATKEQIVDSSFSPYLELHSLKKEDWREKEHLPINFFIPVIIYDGGLYSYNDKGELKEENQILLYGKCYSKKYEEQMMILIIKREYFKDFISQLEEDINKLFTLLFANKSKLDEWVEEFLELSDK